ncbi:MAG: hypothetical protein AUH68_03685 [Gemmatimonadetes bacterium 13_1_40CM_4_69_5]|nr:MAG: hypothetical protein AUH68_03685 [Gemmatimonadetes bacterium 13_1_40CM_4_69_5]
MSSTAAALGEENGGRPAMASNRTPPSEYKSLRASTSGNPAACSGLMYSSVPTTKPLRVTRSSPEVAIARAIPKSTSVAPVSPRTMLSGLMSRCARPAPWACVSTSSTSQAVRHARSTPSRCSRRSTCRSVSPGTNGITNHSR